ncbi:MAG TPA: hypothetical protein VNR90_06495, partial [Vicinamibacterales bacterium]|nr:hypothetical protein [Vicinamibacterales bacterium]
FEVSTGERATKQLSSVWLFAEGSRGGELFDNFFLLYNPYGSPVTARVYYVIANGGVVQRTYTIPGGRRLTVAANEVPELAGKDFSFVVETNTAIVAERAMYWRPLGTPVGTPWVGGHVAMGATASFPNWYFAEAAAGPGFDTFFLLYNPHAATVIVHANFFTESSGLIQRLYTIPPGQRTTIYLNGELGNIGGTAVSLTATSPFIAERSIYWGAGRVEGTSTLGVNTTANVWQLPEGAAGGNFETFLMLGNPFSTDSWVDLSLQIEGYGQVTLPPSMRKLVPHWGRLTLYMPSVLREAEIAEGLPPGSLANVSFATTVKVFTGPPIVAEHAIYWQRDGANFWRGGSAAFGTPR